MSVLPTRWGRDVSSTCVDTYYGYDPARGCTVGFICHPDTGDCVCPPNTMGERCELCVDTYYGYDNARGCTVSFICHPETGDCVCPPNTMGERCELYMC